MTCHQNHDVFASKLKVIYAGILLLFYECAGCDDLLCKQCGQIGELCADCSNLLKLLTNMV